jgi:UDP-N-acetylmuramate dehydrogenase
MNDSILKRARRNADLAPWTYFGLPGKAAFLLETRAPLELASAVAAARAAGQRYFIISGGSNIVVRGGKYDGLVIIYRQPGRAESGQKQAPLTRTRSRLKGEEGLSKVGRRISGPASIPLADAVKFAIENGLAGLEHLSGIPGALAGAIYGNAGAYGHSISEVVEKVLIFDGRAERWLLKKECGFSYRDSIFKKKPWAILAVRLKLKPDSREKLRAYSDNIIASRKEKFSNIKCPGSFFKNVLVKNVSRAALGRIDKTKVVDGKIPAGYLLEEVGAKGMRIGGLYIADYHGNLLINDGTATYKDVEKMVSILKDKVKAKFGIKLEEEVRYLI